MKRRAENVEVRIINTTSILICQEPGISDDDIIDSIVIQPSQAELLCQWIKEAAAEIREKTEA